MCYMNRLLICLLIFVRASVYCKFDREDESYMEDETDFISKSITEQYLESTFQIPDETWTSGALKDIAHYLRNYKFNEWDQRYYQKKPSNDRIGFYNSFPTPVLRTLHWKVYENCDTNFYKCINYLHSVIEIVPFNRNDDVTTIFNEKPTVNQTIITKLNDVCKESKYNSERSSLPFDSPTEKFQWRTTASYYMCWYTMLGTPVLSMLGDTCDNFANCIDPYFGFRNRDPRSDDKMSFACAIYSFCPDPCCPIKHIKHFNQCYDSIDNPCHDNNNEGNFLNKQCTLDKKLNKNLHGIMNNKWNVSCNCKRSGFIWKSQFSMCVDFNECLSEQNICDNQTEDCLNTPGSFKCICRWNYEFDENNRKCRKIDNDVIYKDKLKNDSEQDNNIFTRFFEYLGIF